MSLAVPPPRTLRLPPARGWTFITNHAQVLLAVAQKPDLRVREIAAATEITERYAYRILRDLEDAGYVGARAGATCTASIRSWRWATRSWNTTPSGNSCG